MTNYINLRTELFWTADRSPSWNKPSNPWELRSGRYPRERWKCCRLDPLYMDFPSLHITYLHQRKVFSFSVSSSHIFLKIQSWALRWKKSPSNTVSEWSCEAVVDSVLLISKSPSMQRVFLSAKHPWCWLTSVGSASTKLVRNT